MQRIPILILATLIGCAQMNGAPPPDEPVEAIAVNGTVLSSYDGSGSLNSFQAKWQTNHYVVQVISTERVAEMENTLDRILRMVRQDMPDKEPFEFWSDAWPDGCSVYGVTRGGELTAFVQGQFLLQTPRGNLVLEMFATDVAITETSVREFFREVEITDRGFCFPIDCGTGQRTESPRLWGVKRRP